MIYSNFLFFIIAIIVFSTAHDVDRPPFGWPADLACTLALLAGFWLFNRWRFQRLRADYDTGQISAFAARRFYSRAMVFQSILGLLVFSLTVAVLDLKHLVRLFPLLGGSEFVASLIGVALFSAFLSCVWYWAFRSFGPELETARSARAFVSGNIRFYVAIVVPWLLLSATADVLGLFDGPLMEVLNASPLFQLALLAAVIVAAAWICPPLIVRLWECSPLRDKQLEKTIRSLIKSQGARFRKVLSWDALNRSLVTAAVFGVLPRSRYLLITPSLMKLLDEDEIRAVVSHEIGHVKHRHLYAYFLFFLCFFIVATGVIGLLTQGFLNSETGLNWVTTADGLIDMSVLVLPEMTFMLILFVLFFRFVFGYFMRNFERQADAFCFRTEVDPRHLLSSFDKLNQTMGPNRERKNWHHFTIGERMDFVRRAMDNPLVIKRHHRKVRRSLVLFFGVVAAMVGFSLTPVAGRLNSAMDLNFFEKVVSRRMVLDPLNDELPKVLANVQVELEKWPQARENFEKALAMDPDDPMLANNYAWLLLTCPDESLRDATRALTLAKGAAAARPEDVILDTLAEAYYQNGRFAEALELAQKAYDLSDKKDDHFANQLEKMRAAVTGDAAVPDADRDGDGENS